MNSSNKVITLRGSTPKRESQQQCVCIINTAQPCHAMPNHDIQCNAISHTTCTMQSGAIPSNIMPTMPCIYLWLRELNNSLLELDKYCIILPSNWTKMLLSVSRPKRNSIYSLLRHLGPLECTVLAKMKSCFEDLRSKTFQWKKKYF